MSDVTTTEPSVEDCLKELREMFPDEACLQVTETAWCWKGREGVQHRATILIGELFENFTCNTLSEAMSQVRAWHKEQ